MHAKEILPQIQGGLVYLTLGTVQQIQWICNELNLPITSHYNPTTNEFRTLTASGWDSQPRALIIFYENLIGTGLVNTKASARTTYGQVKTDNKYAIPNDQFLELDSDLYIFITLINPCSGVLDPALKKGAKALEGGLFQILDLSQLMFVEEGDQRYPFVKQRDVEIEPVSARECHDLIEALTKENAGHLWAHISKACLNSKFLLNYAYYGSKYPILLISGRAWGLYPYLLPVLSRIEKNPVYYSVELSRFANWVHLASTAWVDRNNTGLTFVKGRGKKQGYWNFRPSVEAKVNFGRIGIS